MQCNAGVCFLMYYKNNGKMRRERIKTERGGVNILFLYFILMQVSNEGRG